MLYCQFTIAVSRILTKFIHRELATTFKLIEVQKQLKPIRTIKKRVRDQKVWENCSLAWQSSEV